MNETEWLACGDPRPMMEFLRAERGASQTKAGRRRLRLFACVCVRSIWPLLRQDASRNAVAVAEEFASGGASESDLAKAMARAKGAVARESGEIGKSPYWESAQAAMSVCVKGFDGGDHASVAHTSYWAAHAYEIEQARGFPRSIHGNEFVARHAIHVNWLRDIIGNPFRPVRFIPAWRTETAVAIASQMYDSRDFSAMPILADSLQDAGCDNADVLNHCRAAGEHVRGCWVVDLVLGR